MLNSICVRNYRTFQESFTLEIAPITVLLGANSSGKSSVTRLPPLLSQSLSERNSAPILWVSDTIDFGSFKENVHGHNEDEQISFSLGGRLDEVENALSHLGITSWQSADFKYSMDISGAAGQTRIKKIRIDLYNEVVEFGINNGWIENISFRGKIYKELSKGLMIYLSQGMFPAPYFFARDSDGKIKAADRDILKRDLVKVLRSYCHANTTDAALYKVFNYPRMSSLSQTFDWLKIKARQVPSLHRKFDSIKETERDRVWLNLFFANFSTLMTSMQASIGNDVSQGGYLAPVRAAAERYYRHREVAVDKIDPDGGNLAMYLNSLYPHELDQINHDLDRFFGHKVRVHRSEGHISLRLQGEDSYEDNLADVGFGFSQLIPVIAQIHATSRSLRIGEANGVRRRTSPIVAVEQPELHLHPAFQSQLGAYFVSAATEGRSKQNFRFLIETHSEPLVNEIARRVALGEISASDVNIYLFERESKSNSTKVKRVVVEPDGRLRNWPFGFFSSGRMSGFLPGGSYA